MRYPMGAPSSADVRAVADHPSTDIGESPHVPVEESVDDLWTGAERGVDKGWG